MTQSETDPIAYLIELRGVYDGWSIAVHKDGSLHGDAGQKCHGSVTLLPLRTQSRACSIRANGA